MPILFNRKFVFEKSLNPDKSSIDLARSQIAEAIGARDHNSITFTSGGTEALNWVIHVTCESSCHVDRVMNQKIKDKYLVNHAKIFILVIFGSINFQI